MVGREEESRRFRSEVGRWLERKERAVVRGDEEELREVRAELKRVRKAWTKELRRWEKEWWDGELTRCENAAGRGDLGGVYKSLRTLGGRGVKKVDTGTTITKEEFRGHFKRVSEERFENVPEEVERVVDRAVDLRGDERTKGWRERLGRPPDGAKVVKELGRMKSAAPEGGFVQLCFLKKGDERVVE